MQGSLDSFFKGAASSPGASKKRSLTQAGLSKAVTPQKSAVKLNKGAAASPAKSKAKASPTPKKITVTEEVKSVAASVVVNNDVEEEKKDTFTGR